MPEQVLLRQEDLPEINPLDDNVGEDSAGEVIKEPKMYFIAKGKYDVYIQKNHGVTANKFSIDSSKDKQDRILQDGDQFGEIGLIYNCKRTATIESSNYGTLAMLSKSNYNELQKSFENITEVFKKQICMYDDDVKMFLEMSCEKINYFRALKYMTKQEILHSMERVTYEKDHLLCKKDDIATKLFVI